MYPTALWAVAAITIPPASTMPWIEFAADISGVWRVAGTLLMTSKPTHRLSAKMMKSVSSMERPSRSLGRRRLRGVGLPSPWRLGRHGRRGGQRRVHNLALVRDHDSGHQLVVQVDGELAVGDHVQQQRADIARVHRRGGRGHCRRQVVGADDGDSVVGDDGLARYGAFDVAA